MNKTQNGKAGKLAQLSPAQFGYIGALTDALTDIHHEQPDPATAAARLERLKAEDPFTVQAALVEFGYLPAGYDLAA